MVILYPADEHPLLSPKAKSLLARERSEFDAHNNLAEVLLSFSGTTFTSDDADLAAMASAIQINFQLEQGMDPYISYNINSGGGTGSRGTTFRGYKTPPIVHPQALRIAESLVRGIQTVVTSARTRDS